MDRFAKILNKIFSPPVSILAILVVVSIAMLIYAFACPEANEYAVYASYFLSAYTLCAVCVRVPDMYYDIKKLKADNKYINMYVSDAHLRVKISLKLSLCLNTAYAIFQLVLGIYHSSVWFYSLAVYYIMLVTMRAFLLKSREDDLKKEYSKYLFCGVVILCMNIALGVIVFYITWQNRGFEHHYITTIAMAAYTFTALTLAIINIIKYKKYKSPVLSASKAISLVSATVSLLTLETAMLTAFDETNNAMFRRIMTASTGTAVCVFVFVLAIYMIVKAKREIKKLTLTEGD